jgi:23S rRNA (pseudouridine1915-N3)-methyltransferase
MSKYTLTGLFDYGNRYNKGMKITCLAIGKKHDAAIAAAIEDYTKRLQHYTPLTWHILPPAKGKMHTNEIKRTESTALLAQCALDDYVVLLDESGREITSSGLADMLDVIEPQTKRVVYIIGGAFGVMAEVRQRANAVLSLSKLTFPHQIVRLLLAEQLYRANTIRRGEPYHH